MTRIIADHVDLALPFDHFAVFANTFNACTDFHDSTLLLHLPMVWWRGDAHKEEHLRTIEKFSLRIIQEVFLFTRGQKNR